MQVLERVWPQNVDKWREMFPGTRRTGKEPNHLGRGHRKRYSVFLYRLRKKLPKLFVMNDKNGVDKRRKMRYHK